MTAKRKKCEEIAEHLELGIVSDRLKLGERIPSERDLMERFEAGRSGVREALFGRQRKGLLSASAGAVARVGEPTADLMVRELSGTARPMLSRPDGVREMQDARALFEIGLARRAAQRAGSEEVEAPRAALAANGAAADADAFAVTDMAFHTAIAGACGNRTDLAVDAAFSEWLHEQRRGSAEVGATRQEAIAQHRAIFEAIARGDRVAAEDAMETHLATVADHCWRGARAGGPGRA